MGSALLASLIIVMCQGNGRTYIVSGEPTDCHSWYMNCSLNKYQDLLTKNKEQMQQALQECRR